MEKLCECGCGAPAPLASITNTARGWKKGQPIRFISGHNGLKHGQARTTEYNSYIMAKQRCTNPKYTYYSYYGGRGIEFRFSSFEEFISHIGPKPDPKYTLERIDNNGHYEAGNVRWATRAEQRKNTRMRSDNTSGCEGVFWAKRDKKWFVEIKHQYLGSFDNFEDACAIALSFRKGT